MQDSTYRYCYIAVATIATVGVCLYGLYMMFSSGVFYAELGLQARPALRYGLILFPSLAIGVIQWFVAKHIMLSDAPPRGSRHS